MASPVTVKMQDVVNDPAKFDGRYTVLWRNKSKTPAKLLGADKAAGRIKYEIIAGTDKGGKFSARFDPNQNVVVYDDDTLVLGLLDV